MTAAIRRPRRSVVLPREHGAYGQFAFPLLTALVAAHPTAASACLVVSAVAAFCAHQPLLVLAGRRGRQTKQLHASDAWFALVAATVIALTSATAGFILAPAAVLHAAIAPALLATVCAIVAAAGAERTTFGELLAAVALASAALPVGVSAGMPTEIALALTLAWALASAIHTASVRGLVVRARTNGSNVLAHATAVAAGVVWLAAVPLAIAHALAWWAVLALTAPMFASAWLAWAPPPPRALRRVGWSLMTSSALVLAVIVGALR